MVHKNYRALIGVTVILASTLPLGAQPQGSDATGTDSPAFKPEELEQLVAPIALYPDSVIAQILMASTYPLEVVQADRWMSQNKELTGNALADAVEKENWDPSVKSLVNFPQVLTMMSEKLDWTNNLGDAFLAQQKAVMDAIQRLRKKAKETGNLESNEQQKIIVEPAAPAPSGDTTTTTTSTTVTETYIIESASPDVVYVPTYNPTVVYGAWPYPAYPPYSYYPPGYVATAAVSFGLGVAAGAAWGAWGNCNWGHGDIDIDNRSFNSTRIDNSRSASNVGNRNTSRQNTSGKWQHDSSHRKGASYRDQATANKFGGTSTRDAAKSRDSFRGRADAGRQDIARGGADQFKGGQGPSGGARDQGSRGGAGNRPQTADRGGAGSQNRGSQANRAQTGDRSGSASQNRGSQANRTQTADRSGSAGQNRGSQANRSSQSQGNRGGAFDGVGQGSSTRNQSQRGQASRSSPSRSSGGSRSGGGGMSRGGGGGGRGGGGRGGGRR